MCACACGNEDENYVDSEEEVQVAEGVNQNELILIDDAEVRSSKSAIVRRRKRNPKQQSEDLTLDDDGDENDQMKDVAYRSKGSARLKPLRRSAQNGTRRNNNITRHRKPLVQIEPIHGYKMSKSRNKLDPLLQTTYGLTVT